MNLENELQQRIAEIKGANQEAKKEASKYVDSLIKPPKSLGKLESIAISLAGITGNIKNDVSKKRIIVLCADNGVTECGVSSAPVFVTASQAVNMTRGITGMSSMAWHFGIETEIVDVGIATDYDCPQVLDKRIRKGTGNIVMEPALTKEEVLKAILVGIERADNAKNKGVDILGVGEMGIGNTTTSAAVLAAIADASAAEVVGRGGGLTDEAFANKIKVVDKALLRFNKEADDKRDILEIIRQLGGLDVAAMCGVYLGAAVNKMPVVIDGYISVVAALCACKINGNVRHYIFPSHISKEKGYRIAADMLKLKPWLDLDMGLGEGSGCVVACQVLEAACAFVRGMATFEGGGICDDYLADIRKQEKSNC